MSGGPVLSTTLPTLAFVIGVGSQGRAGVDAVLSAGDIGSVAVREVEA